MVFRKESKVDAFQRQISALRQQLGPEDEVAAQDDESRSYASEGRRPEPESESYAPASYQSRDVSGYSFTSQVADYQSDDLEAESSSELAIPTPTVDAQTSVVAHDTTWNGDLQSSGSLHVHGIVDGTLTASEDVYVAEEADVTATITATNVIVAGIVRGTIRCSSRFEVLPRGRVLADVQSPTLVVHEGASITGQVRMGPVEPNTLADQPAQPAQPVVHRRAARNRA